MVRVRDLRMRDGDAEPVIDGVSLDVAEGQVVSLIGPSGSGKSTVLRAIAGLHPPDGGTVELFVDCRETGFLFQDDVLLPWRTARQNVGLGLRLGGAPQAEALAEAARLARPPRARGLRGARSAPALRRAAQAGGAGAGAGAAAEAPAHGRALRLARRHRGATTSPRTCSTGSSARASPSCSSPTTSRRRRRSPTWSTSCRAVRAPASAAATRWRSRCSTSSPRAAIELRAALHASARPFLAEADHTGRAA